VLNECGCSEVGATYAYRYRHETSAMVRAPVERVFAHMDDHARLTSHMSESSWMMGGGSMQVELDAARGQKIGSWIRLSGKILGVTLAVEEIVTERTPPRRKVWETTGVPRLLVIGRYQMGFEIAPREADSHLTVFIDYALPQGTLTPWLGYFLGGYYARWCTQRMVDDAVKHFTANI
jgi:Polyketide cyclase / dehydrase and lipid transport